MEDCISWQCRVNRTAGSEVWEATEKLLNKYTSDKESDKVFKVLWTD